MNVPHAGVHSMQLEWPGGQPQPTPAQQEAWRQQQQHLNPQTLDPVRSGNLEPGAIAQPTMRGTGQFANGYPATSSEFKPFDSIVSDIRHNQADARMQVADQRNAPPAASTMNRYEQNVRPNNDPSVFSGGVNR